MGYQYAFSCISTFSLPFSPCILWLFGLLSCFVVGRYLRRQVGARFIADALGVFSFQLYQYCDVGYLMLCGPLWRLS